MPFAKSFADSRRKLSSLLYWTSCKSSPQKIRRKFRRSVEDMSDERMTDRSVVKIIRMTPKELQMIHQKMEQFGTANFSAFVRKMAIDGYVVRLELPELKELISLLRYSSNNLNQLTKRVHETGRIYDADLEDIHRNQERLWGAAQQILDKLSKL